VRPGELVALKRESGNQLWRVKTIHKNTATCDLAIEGYPPASKSNQEFPVSDLVVVRILATRYTQRSCRWIVWRGWARQAVASAHQCRQLPRLATFALLLRGQG